MPARNEFPTSPVPAVGAIVFREDAVLLVKRVAEPNRGRWSVPGGALETGETVEAGAVRETLEETGVVVRSRKVFDVRDYIARSEGLVRWHYVLIDVFCDWDHGEPSPASDAEDARFLPLRMLGEHDVATSALEVVQAAARERDRPGRPDE